MAFPFHTEGEVVIATDAPSSAERVADGVEKWLRAQKALGLRREPGRFKFRGNPVYAMASTAWRPLGLRGIQHGTIEFEQDLGKVIIRFQITSSLLDISATLTPFVIAVALARISLLFFVPVFIAGITLHIRLTPRLLRRYFEKELFTAAIRGLADGAARELAELQAR